MHVRFERTGTANGWGGSTKSSKKSDGTDSNGWTITIGTACNLKMVHNRTKTLHCLTRRKGKQVLTQLCIFKDSQNSVIVYRRLRVSESSSTRRLMMLIVVWQHRWWETSIIWNYLSLGPSSGDLGVHLIILWVLSDCDRARINHPEEVGQDGSWLVLTMFTFIHTHSLTHSHTQRLIYSADGFRSSFL